MYCSIRWVLETQRRRRIYSRRRNHFRCRKAPLTAFRESSSGTFCKVFFVRNSLESQVIVTGKTTTGVNLRERWWNVCPQIASDFHRAMSSGILSKTELTSASLSHTIISIIFSFLLFSLLFLFSFLFSLLSLCCILFLKNHKMRRKTSSFYRLSIRSYILLFRGCPSSRSNKKSP